MTNQTLSSLADRVEAASDDREMFQIDCEIEALIFDKPLGMMRRFTQSIDAAMLLVPRGWSAKLIIHDSECHVEIYKLGEVVEVNGGLMRPFADGGTPIEAGPCKAAALALVVASLRALAQQEGL